MSVSTSPGAGAFERADAGTIAVIAWLSNRLFTPKRTRLCENADAFLSVKLMNRS